MLLKPLTILCIALITSIKASLSVNVANLAFRPGAIKIVQDVAVVCNFYQNPCSIFSVQQNGSLGNSPIVTLNESLFASVIEMVVSSDNKTVYLYRSSVNTPALYTYKIDLPLASADNVSLVYSETLVTVCSIVLDYHYKYLYGVGCGWLHQYDISNYIPNLIQSQALGTGEYASPKPGAFFKQKLYLAEIYTGAQVIDLTNGLPATLDTLVPTGCRIASQFDGLIYYAIEWAAPQFSIIIYDPVKQSVVGNFSKFYLPGEFIVSGGYMITNDRGGYVGIYQMPSNITYWDVPFVPYLETTPAADPHGLFWYKNSLYSAALGSNQTIYFDYHTGNPNGFALMANLTNPYSNYGYWLNPLSLEGNQTIYQNSNEFLTLNASFLPNIVDSENSSVNPIYITWEVDQAVGNLRVVNSLNNATVFNCSLDQLLSSQLILTSNMSEVNSSINFIASNSRGGRAQFTIKLNLTIASTFTTTSSQLYLNTTTFQSAQTSSLIVSNPSSALISSSTTIMSSNENLVSISTNYVSSSNSLQNSIDLQSQSGTSAPQQSFLFSFSGGANSSSLQLASNDGKSNDIASQNQNQFQSFLADNLLYIIIGASVLGVLLISIFALMCIRKRRKSQIKNILSDQYTQSSDVYNNTTQMMTNSTINGGNTTLNVTQTPLSIPAYLQFNFGSDFRSNQLITRGGTSKIFSVTFLNLKLQKLVNGEQCIVKVIDSNLANQENMKASFFQEISMYSKFGHLSCFPKMYAFSDEPMAVVLKYYSFGSLKQLIYGQINSASVLYSSRSVISILRQFADGINYMHLNGFVHLDIKPENILLDVDQNGLIIPIITDFGVSKLYDESRNLVKSFQLNKLRGLTLNYAAPEMILSFKKQYEFVDQSLMMKCDVFSTGAMMYEMMTRERLWRNYMK